MTELTDEMREKAFYQWKSRDYQLLEMDEAVRSALTVEIKSPRAWLRGAREALWLSGTDMAEKLQISRSHYLRLEIREKNGKLSLEQIRKIAEAMDCEVIYAIRPKSRISFARVIWNRLRQISEAHWWVRSRPAHLKINALCAIARRKMHDPEVRRRFKWSERYMERSSRRKPLKFLEDENWRV